MSQNLKGLMGDWLEDLELGHGRSPKTVANYDHYLKRFFDQQQINSVAGISMDAVRAFRRYLNEHGGKNGLKTATINYHLTALRQFLKYLAKRDVAALAPEKIELAKVGEREIDVLYPEEVDALLNENEGDENEGVRYLHSTNTKVPDTLLRDKAILHLLFSTGLRISEAVQLDRDDIRENSHELAVRGKGNKVRVAFLSSAAAAAVHEYIAARHDVDPALFIRHKKNVGAQDDLRLTPRSIQRLIKQHAAAAGITKNITPHTLRHSFATDLLTNGADVRQVQQLLGHASITTTQIYTHLTDVRLKEVHERYHNKGLLK